MPGIRDHEVDRAGNVRPDGRRNVCRLVVESYAQGHLGRERSQVAAGPATEIHNSTTMTNQVPQPVGLLAKELRDGRRLRRRVQSPAQEASCIDIVVGHSWGTPGSWNMRR